MKIYTESKVFKIHSKFGEKNRENSETELYKRTLAPNHGQEEQSSDNEPICTGAGVKKSMQYYLQNTTLHGLKYIAEDRLTLPERFLEIFFGLSFILVTILSTFFISNIYVKWSASPIIISTSAKQTLTTDIPFPAITICNLNQALKDKVDKIKYNSSNYWLLKSLCSQGSDDTSNYSGTWKYFKETLQNVAQPCNKMLLYCSFGSKQESCSTIFNSVLTDDGLCCTFNALDQSFLLRNYTEDSRFQDRSENPFKAIDWTPEQGYASDLPPHFFPRTSGGTGSRMGLTVILNSSSDQYYCSKSKSIGFKILVHNPAELPKISNYGFLVTAGREARVPIEPIYQDAVASIRSIKKEVRRCLFSDEGDLVYYRTYSRKSCELECEAKILITKCNCVLYYLPRIDPGTRICGPKDNICTNMVQTEIESADRNVSCASCLPGCFELNYKTTVTASTIVLGGFYSADDLPEDIFNSSTNIKDISIIHFYYLSNIFRSTTKSEMFGFTEFLSNTGGLLGLFMGFSIFSLIEIVYYITVRPYCANRTLRKNQRSRHLESKTMSKRKAFKNDQASLSWMNYTPKKTLAIKKYKNSLRKILERPRRNFQNGGRDVEVFPYLN